MKRDSMYRSLESDGQTGNRLAKPPPEEPDALVAHVRVCEGPGRQRPGLLGKTEEFHSSGKSGSQSSGHWKRSGRLGIAVALCGAMAVVPLAAQAQYAGNYQTNTISAVTNNWSGNYVVGSNYVGDVLLIKNTGVLNSAAGFIGYAATANSNRAIITGGGSIWTNSGDLTIGNSGSGNSLVVTNGGMVFDADGIVGNNASASNNTVLISGTGSVWTCAANVVVGYAGSGNTLTVSNGGILVTSSGYIGYTNSASSNAVVITGPGSAWNSSGSLNIGGGDGNTLSILNAGACSFGAMQVLSNGAATIAGTPLNTGTASINGGQMTVSNCTWSGGNVYANWQGLMTIAGGTSTLATINAGTAANSTGMVVVSGTQLSTGSGLVDDRIGSNGGVGQMTFSNSVWQPWRLKVGESGGIGTLTLINSSLTTIRELAIGGYTDSSPGTGTVSVVVGVLNVTYPQAHSIVDVGNLSGPPGTVAGSALLTFSNATAWVNTFNIGYRGTGTLTIAEGSEIRTVRIVNYSHGMILLTGGHLSTTNSGNMLSSDPSLIYNGQFINVGSHMTVSGGRWDAQDAFFELDNQNSSSPPGTLTITGGTNCFVGTLWIGGCPSNSLGIYTNGPGVVTITGGLLVTTNTPTPIGYYGFGQLTASGGTWIAQDVCVAQYGGSTGIFTIAGGNVILNHLIATNAGSNFALNSGSLSIRGAVLPTPLLTVGDGTNAATLNLLAGEPAWNSYNVLVEPNSTLNFAEVTAVSGTITNYGTLSVPAGQAGSIENLFTTTGAVVLYPDSFLNVSLAWTNSGVITLGGDAALGGAMICNTGVIQGDGTITAPLVNGPGGQIQVPTGDWMTLRNVSLNQGGITNNGGILDVMGAALTNAGVIGGYGIFSGNAIVNKGSVLFSGGASTVYGNYVNTTGATTYADGVTAAFYGTVTNNGTMQGIDGGALKFYGTVVNNGTMNYVLGQAVFHGTNGLVDTDYKQAILHGTLVNNGVVLSPDGDWDSDGLSNYQEYIADTDPTNPASYFHVITVSNLPPWTVYFVSNTGRIYTLNGSSNLVTSVWTNVPGAGPRLGAGGADTMQDTNKPPKGPFYRLKVQMP